MFFWDWDWDCNCDCEKLNLSVIDIKGTEFEETNFFKCLLLKLSLCLFIKYCPGPKLILFAEFDWFKVFFSNLSDVEPKIVFDFLLPLFFEILCNSSL